MISLACKVMLANNEVKQESCADQSMVKVVSSNPALDRIGFNEKNYLNIIALVGVMNN